MGQRHMRCPLLADRPCEPACIHAAHPDASALFKVGGQLFGHAPVRGLGRVPFDDHPCGDRIGGFIVFGVDPGVADVGEGEGHDLARIRRICHDLLIAGHGGVKAQLGSGLARRPKAYPVKDGPICKSKAGGWFRRHVLIPRCHANRPRNRRQGGGGQGLANKGMMRRCARLSRPLRIVMLRLRGTVGIEFQMDMRTRVNTALKDAMKAKEADRLSTLRLINAAIKDKDIALRGTDQEEAGVGDPEVLAIMGRMVKQRQESARAYEEGGRLELAEKEQSEIKIIEEFLPKQLSEDETAAAVDAAITQVGADSIRDMGKVMGVLKGKYTGQMDFGKTGPLVKARLG